MRTPPSREGPGWGALGARLARACRDGSGRGARLCPAAARAPGDVPLVTRQQASGTAAAPNPERGACASGDLLPVAPEGSLEERTAARRPGGGEGSGEKRRVAPWVRTPDPGAGLELQAWLLLGMRPGVGAGNTPGPTVGFLSPGIQKLISAAKANLSLKSPSPWARRGGRNAHLGWEAPFLTLPHSLVVTHHFPFPLGQSQAS